VCSVDGARRTLFLAGLTALHTDRYDWESLPEGSVVVDVGGGIGSVTDILAKAHPHLKFIIQDQLEVVEDGLKVNTSTYFALI